MEWFSSDFHLRHRNILQYDNRPFKTIEEHDQAILENCLSVMKKGDKFYYLGDLVMGSMVYAKDFLYNLMFEGIDMYFIKGNHDKKDTIKLYEKYGTYLGEQKKIKIGEQGIVLNHFKMYVWDKSHREVWHLYGHSHGSAEHFTNGKSFDVGINLWDYKPVSFDKIKEIMSTREIQRVDHHNETTK